MGHWQHLGAQRANPTPPKLEPQPHQFPQSSLPSADMDPSWHLCTATISPLVFSSPNPSFFHLPSLSHPLSVTDCKLFWIRNPNGSAYVYANVFSPVLGPTSLSLWTISCVLGPNEGASTDPTNWHPLNQQREAQSQLDYKLRCILMQMGWWNSYLLWSTWSGMKQYLHLQSLTLCWWGWMTSFKVYWNKL